MQKKTKIKNEHCVRFEIVNIRPSKSRCSSFICAIEFAVWCRLQIAISNGIWRVNFPLMALWLVKRSQHQNNFAISFAFHMEIDLLLIGWRRNGNVCTFSFFHTRSTCFDWISNGCYLRSRWSRPHWKWNEHSILFGVWIETDRRTGSMPAQRSSATQRINKNKLVCVVVNCERC